jgi:hypothetical protein
VFPNDGADADSLLRTADEAMYGVKRTGRNNFAFAARLQRGAESPAPKYPVSDYDFATPERTEG